MRALVLLKSNFVAKLIDFPKIRYKNVEYFNLVHAHKPKFQTFLALVLSFFWVLLLMLPFAFHILSGCPKQFGVN